MSTAPIVPSQALRLVTISPSPTNPRRAFDKTQLQELTDSVKRHGVLQPLLVRPWPAGRKPPKAWPHPGEAPLYELVAGERRARAAAAAGHEQVPGLVRDLSDAEVLEIQLVENLQRTDLHPLEEAEGYRQLMAAKYDVARIADRVGRSPHYIYDRVKLLNLTKDLQRCFRDGEFTVGHAVILARLKPEDQQRALAPAGGLFTEERTRALFTPEEEEEQDALQERAAKAAGRDPYEDDGPRKAVSVRELQSWVNAHTKLEADEVDQMLLPETAHLLQSAEEQSAKVVRITYDQMTPGELQGQPGKVILGRSWARADGLHGSKQCDRSVIGMVVIGPGRGQAFPVCTDKKRCAVHWGDRIKAAKKREKEVAKAGGTGEDREALRKSREEQEAHAEKATRDRWLKAAPGICAAIVGAILDANPTATGPLAAILGLEKPTTKKPHPIPPGKTAEDLVRHLAYEAFVELHSLNSDYGFHGYHRKNLQAAAKESFGIDVQKLVDQLAPAEPKPAKAKPAKKAKRAA